MATITISADAASLYPLASDNVFGIPSTFNVMFTQIDFSLSESVTVIANTWEQFDAIYESGVARWTEVWSDGALHVTTQAFYLENVRHTSAAGGPDTYRSRATQITTDGITFIPNFPTPISGLDYRDLHAVEITNGSRLLDPSTPSVALSRVDTITNLSATGALLMGYGGSDTIVGGSGADTLDGGAGNDSLIGGSGDDVYFVTASDQVIETAGGGFDTVFTTTTFVAAPNASIEKIVAQGAGNIAISGNGQAIEIIGNAGVNTLDDGGGPATLKGGAGTDIYHVQNAATQVIELSGEGYDTVRTELAAYALGDNLEVLTHLGGSDFVGLGNDLSNALTGNSGDDTLDGAGGSDLLTGGGGADHFRFEGLTFGQDRITDFDGVQDLIELSAIGFGIASLNDVLLVANGAATAVGQATLHYYANGALAFDANGGGAADAIVFATLQGHPSLSIDDFALI